MSNLPARQLPTPPAGLEEDYAAAQILVQSKYYAASGRGSPETYEQDVAQVMVKIMWGREMGLGRTVAVDGIDVIEGKPSPSGGLVAACIDAHPCYAYAEVTRTSEVCRLAFYSGRDLAYGSPYVDGRWEAWATLNPEVSATRDPIPLAFGLRPGVALRGVEEFTIADAENAKLTGKDNWRKYAKAMLFNRAVTSGQRAYAPALWGGARLYTPDELGADTDTDTSAPTMPAERPATRRKAQPPSVAPKRAPKSSQRLSAPLADLPLSHRVPATRPKSSQRPSAPLADLPVTEHVTHADEPSPAPAEPAAAGEWLF